MRLGNIEQKAGEVWFAELGMVEKSRPVLVLSSVSDASARSLVVVAPLTSQIRGGFGEVALGKLPWLPKLSAVNVQGLASMDRHKLVRRLGVLPTDRMNEVKRLLRILLEL
jgi:mRNA-degrading endonuclease toxin of MazEF toxin-antitoxin module